MFQFKYFHIPRTLSRNYCHRALEALESTIHIPQEGVIHLIAVDMDSIAHINKQFRGKEGPTDILTFSFLKSGLQEPSGPDLVIGEIYLCLDKIKLYAKERGVTYREQLEYIIIHGLVHLAGYDHNTDKDWREMERVERTIKEKIAAFTVSHISHGHQ